ncbi:Imm50 family immunity protein [Clostridium beijerinckii]|uniref:Uncharacterized protein n=1 Tax=Clostridium beijerinckii TaxID=1520 RepID=A0A7X9XRK3_CLOBE|nr:Imm50 family immunity protein [Clostridium beijerinckii]NMF07624.1 hypothetical protein [Clostridium beijerinckii]
MDKSFIIGHEKIESDFGYFPSFHDDVINKIEISNEGITFIIDIENPPTGMSSYPKVKLMFCGVNDYYLEGEIYGCASIILDIQFIKVDDYIETQISSSLGACGTIRSNKVEIGLQ